jgi:hypothetical protein
MKKQIDPTIKAHLLRGALYLLLLLAVCVIPFALAQRNTTKRSVAKPKATTHLAAAGKQAGAPASLVGAVRHQLPYDGPKFPYSSVRAPGSAVAGKPAWRLSNKATSGPSGVKALRILPMPKLPRVVLYDQYDNDLNNGIVSADRTDDTTLSAEAADNFVVPAGETWQITEVDIRGASPGLPAPTSFAIHFYTDASGFPGTEVYSATGLAVVGDPDFVITLTSPANLSEGTYWVSAVGTIVGNNWYWEGRSITNNGFATAWRNPENGYGTGCTDWGRLETCIGIPWPDQMFRIVGTTGGGGGCATYTTTTGTGPIVPGTTDTGSHCDDCTVPITFPFPVSVYGNSYTDANISSNGNLQFAETIGYLGHGCNPLPVDFMTGPVIFGYWDDLMTNTGLTNCTTWANGCGVFTATTGSAPNRTFYIEWHAVHYFDGPAADFEMVFYENNPNLFDIFYGATSDNGSDETSGVQASATGPATTFSCGDSTLTNGLDVTYTCAGASPTPTPTGTPGQGCGLLVGSGITLGYPPNGFTLIASNTVNYTFANSQSAPNEFAVFETHDPWGGTVLTDAITANGHTFTTFTPGQLAGFAFSDYRVVVLNWDDTFLSDFLADYSAAIPALEAYVNNGGVVWVQASIQGSPGDNFPFPFGGQGNGADFSGSDPIVDPASPMMTGMPNPIPGNAATDKRYDKKLKDLQQAAGKLAGNG